MAPCIFSFCCINISVFFLYLNWGSSHHHIFFLYFVHGDQGAYCWVHRQAACGDIKCSHSTNDIFYSSQYIHTLNIRPSLEDSKYIAAISGLHKEIFVANLCTYRYKILVWSDQIGRAIGLALWWHTERNSRSLSSDHMANQLPCNRHFSDLLFLAQWVHSAYCSWLHWEEVDEWQGCQGCQLCPLHITSRHPLRHSPRHIRNKNKNIENEKKKTLPAPSPFLSTHFLLILIRQYKTPPTIGTIEYEDIKKDQSANWGTQSKIKRTKDCTIVKSAHLKGNFRKRWNFSHVQKFLVIFKITKFLEFLVVSIIGETSSTTNSIWQLLARNNITFNHQFTDQPKSTPVLLAVTATGYHQVIVTIINH